MHFFNTELGHKLGLKYPVIAAPMFLISNADMVVACAEAGILGSMPALNCRTPEDFAATLEDIRQRTDKPFAINLTIGLTDPTRLEQDIDLCLRFKVPVLITSYGNPTNIVQRAHANGAKVFHDVINLRHAKVAERAGVDAVIAVASGAGGHAGTTSPFALIPYLRQNLSIPVIAAGCIAGGRQIAAALALGASAAYVGTRMIASTESGADDEYKKAVINGAPEDIVYTDKVSGTNANFLKHTIPAENEATDAKRWRDIWSAGHGIAVTHAVLPIAEIVDEMVSEYLVAVEELHQSIGTEATTK